MPFAWSTAQFCFPRLASYGANLCSLGQRHPWLSNFCTAAFHPHGDRDCLFQFMVTRFHAKPSVGVRREFCSVSVSLEDDVPSIQAPCSYDGNTGNYDKRILEQKPCNVGRATKHGSTVISVTGSGCLGKVSDFPHFVTAVGNREHSPKLQYLPRNTSSADSVKYDGKSEALSGSSSSSGEAKSAVADTPCEGSLEDEIRLQQRYASLVHTPELFNKDVQFLQYVIRQQQEKQRQLPFMRDLLCQQLELRKLGGEALTNVKPVIYAAFCMHFPKYVFVNAAMRVGAARHFLTLLAKTRRKLTNSPSPNHRRPDTWLNEVELQNVCVYPLEVLPAKLRLFRLVAHQRIDMWAQVFECALG